MKIGYNEATARDCSTLAKDLELCEAAGFDYIEIRLDMLDTYLLTHSLEELCEFFTTHKLKPHAFNALYLYDEMYSENDIAENRNTLESRFLSACRIGQRIGVHYFIIVPPLREKTYDKGFAYAKGNCVRALNRLSDMAAEYNMNLCFELVGLKKSSVRTISQVKEIVESVNKPNVGYVFDAYNIYSCGKTNDFSQIKDVDKNKVFAVHINNADDCPEEMMGQDKRRLCDKGIICLTNFLKVLKEIKYEGMVSIETFRPEYWQMDPEEVISRAYETTKNILEDNDCL